MAILDSVFLWPRELRPDCACAVGVFLCLAVLVLAAIVGDR